MNWYAQWNRLCDGATGSQQTILLAPHDGSVTTMNEKTIDVYVVISETREVIRVTGDPVDAQRYRDVFQQQCAHLGKIEILKRQVTI